MTEKKYKVLVTDTSVRPEGTDLLRSIAELDFLETRATTAVLVAAVGVSAFEK